MRNVQVCLYFSVPPSQVSWASSPAGLGRTPCTPAFPSAPVPRLPATRSKRPGTQPPQVHHAQMAPNSWSRPFLSPQFPRRAASRPRRRHLPPMPSSNTSRSKARAAPPAYPRMRRPASRSSSRKTGVSARTTLTISMRIWGGARRRSLCWRRRGTISMKLVGIPEGWSFQIMDVNSVGYIYLETGAVAMFNSLVYWSEDNGHVVSDVPWGSIEV